MSLIKHETIADYRTAVNSIEERGYVIRWIIIDMDIITKTTGLNEEELAADFDFDIDFDFDFD